MSISRLGSAPSRACASAVTASAVIAGALLIIAGGCGPSEGRGPRIKPHLSPMSFGDIFRRPSDVEPDPHSNTYVPFEWTLLVQSVGTEPLLIDEVCIVGDHHNGEQGNNAFYFEGPDTYEIEREAGIRITYDHRDTNRDLNGDGEPDPDQIALVIQSNAVDFPTLIVPICARIISTSREPGTFDCISPVEAPPEGEALPDLCDEGI